MLPCSACMERALQIIIGNPVLSSPSIRSSVATSLRRKPFARNYGSKPSRPRSHGINPIEATSTMPWNSNSSSISTSRKFGTVPRPRDQYPGVQDRLLDTGGVPLRKKDYKLEKSMEKILKKHPAYANDPLKLADYVRKALRGDDLETALAVVRAASKNLACTVSWNHLIDWQMSKGKMNAALKTFNEMKKRGQQPDAHTYTIIIRGCTEHKDLSQALGKVMAIYQSMLAERSIVKPNTIHLNAILKMCARAKDMDAMFAVVAQMPTRGLTAPNNLTFTTIINAIRMNAAGDFRSTLTPMQKRQNAEKAIIDARHLWKDITKRWRQGDIWIDEELVCAMGRLMLIGTTQDCDDILSLVEQSMNIPRQVSRMGTPGRETIDPASQGKKKVEHPEIIAVNPSNQEASLDEPRVITEDNFQVIKPPTPASGASAYAKPGRNTLSLVMTALGQLRLKDAATKYWQVMVKEIRIVPDSENYHAYLRILRVARASAETLILLQRMPPTMMRGATFRIAMACCDRDKNNRGAFSHADKIIDIMSNALKVPDIPVLATYLDIATSSTGGLSKRLQGKQILHALEKLNPGFVNVKSLLLYGDPDENMTKSEQKDFKESVLLLTRRMIGAYDLLLDQALVEREIYSELTANRSKLASFISRHVHAKQTPQDLGLPDDFFVLSPHLMAHVNSHGLYKAMVSAKLSAPRWKQFTQKLEKEYQFEQQVHQTKELQGKPARNYVEKLVEEERAAAEEVSRSFKEAA